jgi:hypothetical protein
VVGNLGTSPDLLVTVRSLLFTDLSACLAQWPTDKLLAQAVVVLVGILSASMFEVRLGSVARRSLPPSPISVACFLSLASSRLLSPRVFAASLSVSRSHIPNSVHTLVSWLGCFPPAVV